ncbi:hypothetical protein M758_UG340600 [Ceratodon purpureus]|nr:hypothetical protein M758_UG340600 [Ceratodon purpureus]
MQTYLPPHEFITTSTCTNVPIWTLQFMCLRNIGSVTVYWPRNSRPTRQRSMCSGCSSISASWTLDRGTRSFPSFSAA